MWYKYAKKHDTIMVALYPSISQAKKIAQDKAWFLREKSRDVFEFEPEKPEDLHLSLMIIESPKELRDKKDIMVKIIERIGEEYSALKGVCSGLGYFPSPTGDAIYANFNCAELPDFRHHLVESMRNVGVEATQKYGFIPHITLGYVLGDASGQQLIGSIGQKTKMNFLGKDVEVWGNFKVVDLAMDRLVMKWEDETLCDIKLSS